MQTQLERRALHLAPTGEANFKVGKRSERYFALVITISN